MNHPARHQTLATTLLILLCVSVLLPGLGRFNVKRVQEVRVLLTSRNMAEGGSWVLPRFGNEIRLRKPPLMYWLVATSFRLAHSSRSAFAARLPSVVAGTLLTLTVYLGGARLMGRRRSFLSALVLATSFVFIRHARLAETDMPLTLFVTGSTLLAFLALSGRTPGLAWLLCGVLCGLGFLTKGVAAPAIPILAALGFCVTAPSAWKNVLTPKLLPGLAAALALALPWYLIIWLKPNLHQASTYTIQDEFQRLLVEPTHYGPFYYYLYTLPERMLPWGLALPFALRAIWKRARHHRGIRFLLCWLITSFLMLSLLPQKQSHYALLLLPPAALAVGWFMGGGRGILRRQRKARIVWGWALFCALGVSVGVCLLDVIHSPAGLLPSFARAAEPYLEAAPSAFTVGRYPGSLEFYLGRTLKNAASLQEAWTQSEPGGIILALSNQKRPLDFDRIPVAPALEESRWDLRCCLFMKPPAPAEEP